MGCHGFVLLVDNIWLFKALRTSDRDREPILIFSRENIIDVLPRNNDPIVITIQYANWDVK